MQNNKKQQKSCSTLCQVYKPTILLNYISIKWTNMQEASGSSTAPNATRTISCKARNSPVEYPCGECKNDTKGSQGNMFIQIYKENVQGRKHPGSCAFAEPDLLRYRKPKRVVQNEKNGHKNPNNSQTIMIKIMMK